VGEGGREGGREGVMIRVRAGGRVRGNCQKEEEAAAADGRRRRKA